MIDRIVIVNLIVILINLSNPCLGYHLLPTNTSLIRNTRQANCSPPKVLCNDGTCVPVYKVCDGNSDCPDGADEFDNCNPSGCSEFAFQCAYSACVDGDARCNGRQECKDGSDESGCNTNTNSNNNKCGSKFTCKSNGECLYYYKVCDGVADCPDGSDETFNECKNVPCPEHAFRCSYGACVDSEFKCNGQRECADGSDENPAICGKPTTPKPSPIQPSLPNGFCPSLSIQNGRYKVLGDGYKEGPIPNLAIVTIHCDEHYALYPPINFVNCINGSYSSDIPQCRQTCPQQISSSADITCTIDGSTVDCTKPVVEGTVAKSNCKHLYHSPFSNPITTSICKGGSWDYPPIKCTPECGQLISKGATYVVNGQSVTLGEFPWHIGLYRLENGNYAYKCGGSIITPLVIISAAHCFTNYVGKKDPEREFYVAAGKYYSDYNAEQDFLAQKSQVKRVHIPATYRGYLGNFAGDIAVVVVVTAFIMTNVVQPVCIDWQWQNDRESEQLKPNNLGSVVGWGYEHPRNTTASKTLKQLIVPYIDNGQCLNVVPAQFVRWVTPDKFCAGYTNGSSVCQGDSGGGLVFEWKENSKQIFYLRGLVSVGPLSNRVCDNFEYGVYTKVSQYKDFITSVEAQNRLD